MITYVSEKPKKILRGKSARAALRKGINAVADTVKITLGPWGRNVIYEREHKPARTTNDGIRAAYAHILEDPHEDLGAQIIKQAADRTNSEVGDATSTTVVLAQAIINEGFDRLGTEDVVGSSNENAIQIFKDVHSTKDEIVKELKKMSRPVKDLKELERVASISVEDDSLGKMIAGMVWKLGSDGAISVEEGINTEIESEIVEGGRWYGHYISTAQITDESNKRGIYENFKILVTNNKIDIAQKLNNIVNQCIENKVSLLVLSPEFNLDAVKDFTATSKYHAGKGSDFRLWGMKIKALTDDQKQDIATFVGAKFINSDDKLKIEDVVFEDLGEATQVIVDEHETKIIGGKGDKAEVKKRIESLKGQIKLEKEDMFRKKIQKRISALNSGIGFIRVGALTNQEMGYRKDKIEDCVYATKAAMEEGIVPGGGKALLDISKTLPKGNILKDPITRPYYQIQENAGGKLAIGKDVFDPTKAVRVALESACSVAGTMITAEVAIADIREKPLGDIKKVLEVGLRAYNRRSKPEDGEEDPYYKD